MRDEEVDQQTRSNFINESQRKTPDKDLSNTFGLIQTKYSSQ